MEAVEDDEKGRDPVMLVRDVHGLVQMSLLGRSNYCQTRSEFLGKNKEIVDAELWAILEALDIAN